MAFDPGVGVAINIGCRLFAIGHQVVLRVDVANGQLHHFKQLGSGGGLFGKGLVRHNLLLVHYEAVVLAVGKLGVKLALLAGQRRERHFQPDHILAGLDTDTKNKALFTAAETHRSFAETVTAATVCEIRREDFQKLLLQYPQLSLRILSVLAARVQQLEQQDNLLHLQVIL